MTGKELLRLNALTQKYEKDFLPNNKHAIFIHVSKYNLRWIYRNWKAKRTELPELEV